MNKRVGITIRFNSQQQQEFRELQEFWSLKGLSDPKALVRFAVDQLAQSTKQLKTKLEQTEDVSNTSSSSDSSPSDVAETEPTAEPAVNPS